MRPDYMLFVLLAGVFVLVTWLFYSVVFGCAGKIHFAEGGQKPEQEKGPDIKNIFYGLLGLMVWVGLGVFFYTTFIEGWAYTSNSSAPGDVGCTRPGDCY